MINGRQWYLSCTSLLVLALGLLGSCGRQIDRHADHLISKGGREGYIAVEENLHLHYKMVGQGRDTLIIPGKSWDEGSYDSLAENHTLVLYDMRSRGASDFQKFPDRIGLDYDLKDLEIMVDSLGIQRFSFIGNSYLTLLGALYASLHKESIKSMILIGVVAVPTSEGPGMIIPNTLSDSLVAFRERAPGESSYDYCKNWLSEVVWPALSPARTPPNTLRADPCQYENEHPDKLMDTLDRIFETIEEWEWEKESFDVYCPILIVHGDQDPTPMAWAEFWTGQFPNARLLRVENSGHMPWMDRPELLQQFEEFLSGNWPGTAEIVQP